ncbi:Found in Mitochondrial Proteome [Teratosphaeria destructans]|uniref:Found in Mitochondrial Proteome n=1 Tax=Teratosphaeria destructans TaxID=418781 RepID=A0A9W7SRH4_9PEZI|nr:Found in Mitochondrial Proteome [Teratosphaeria destructans]
MAHADRLLQRPLYVFDLPEELLYSLHLKTPPSPPPAVHGGGEEGAPSPTPTPPPPPTVHGEDAAAAAAAAAAEDGAQPATSCALCGLTFADLPEQRSHVRSDLHGYNLKQRLRGRKAVSEREFETLVAQLDEGLSGSDTPSSDDDDDDDDDDDAEDDGLGSRKPKPKESTLSALLKRQAKVTDGDAEDAPRKRARGQGQGKPPLLWFTSSQLPANTSLGVYRALFSDDEQSREDQLVDTIRRKQLAPAPPPPSAREREPKPKPHDGEEDEGGGVAVPASMCPKGPPSAGPHYFLCMIGGGHFAAVLVSLVPHVTKKAGLEDRAASVLAHKTFHRYTTRRKQGGAQSANDNAKGNAHSAGSSIRRYNEAALTHEVRQLLAEWKPWIDTADLLFVRASGGMSRRTLFGPYEGQVLSVKDERVRGFPFNTRRATQAELMRAFVELTRVKVDVVDEAALARQADEAAAAAQKAEALAHNKPSKPKPAKPSREDEEAALHTTQLQALIRRSKAPGLVSYVQSHSLSPDFTFFPPDQNHHAPTPLHLAASLNSPACRRHPPRLSQAEADSRTAREKSDKAEAEAEERSRRAKEVEKMRQADRERLVGERESKFGKGQAVGVGRVMTAEERRAEEARGMSPEMKMRLEREKRARAAEERIRRLQGR